MQANSWLGRLVLTISRRTPMYRAAGLDRLSRFSHVPRGSVESETVKTLMLAGRNVVNEEKRRVRIAPSGIRWRPNFTRRFMFAKTISTIVVVAVCSLLLVYSSYHRQRGCGLQRGSVAHPAATFSTSPIAFFSVVDPACPVAFGPDGRIMATGTADKKVVLWDVTPLLAANNKLSELDSRRDALATLPGVPAPVSAMAFSPDGRTLATGGADRVLLWDLAEPDRPHVSRRLAVTGLTASVSAVAFSSDGRTLATGGADKDQTIVLGDFISH